ncbi:MAG TPA: hypothetical protein VLT59_12540 [Steroidobacteraceae bacterium]|nr:hypothetical protein [Steroidobacteraceae bacterium]
MSTSFLRRLSGPPRIFALLLILAGMVPPAFAIEWPQEIDAPEGKIVVYQPQPESLEGNTLKGRAAMALEVKGKDEPIFGAFWFTSKIDTDRAAGTALIRDIKVTDVRWPDSKDTDEQRFTQIVEAAVPQSGFDISLDRLTASLATAEVEQKSLENLKHDPPKIVFSDELAVLLLYDGKPRFVDIEGSGYERAMNTPLAVARNKRSKTVYLSSGKLWYEAKDPLGPFTPTTSPPSDLVKMVPKSEDDAPAPSPPPKIVVATEPTELIATDGKPEWTSLTGGQILFVKNTETPWLRDLPTGNMYVLLSGRWYRSNSEAGPWTFVPADKLPAGFNEIPPASDIGGLRVSVAGTEEAEEAVLDQQIPQTAAIKRSEAKLEVQYDGSPKFEKIAGTNVSYAVNTNAQVLEISGKYYAVDNGVWFAATKATGPWVVADSIPQDEINKIPPSAPVYNTTYVNIYDSTPDVVYVGYRPGYMWSYPYYGVPVYGTGWYYPPYWGSYYYPRPPTWGFNVGYNPWTGWHYGLSWSNGFFSFGVSWGGGYPGYYRPWGCCSGWYGGGYRGPTIINTGDINIGNTVNVGNRTNIGNRLGKESNVNIGQIGDRSNNLYKRPENLARNADRATVAKDLKQARPAADRANDVYADKSGVIARRDADKWEVREEGQWKDAGMSQEARDRVAGATPEQRQQAAQQARDRVPENVQRPATSRPATTTPATRPAPSTRPAGPSIDRRDLNRAHQARQTGMSREMARPRAGGVRGR